MTVEVVLEPRRPQRQDTFDLRNDIHTDNSDNSIRYQHHQETIVIGSDEDHSMMDDDSSNEDRDNEYMDDDDGSSSLSIPNESIDFDLVYSLHNFAATVEGQASVVKGDSLFLMDDSNSYWWLVRVLTTQEVGYIPAENIETPFERLARLNKHRNVDLASATQEELQENVQTSRDRIRGIRTGNGGSPLGQLSNRKSVIFTNTSQVFNYPPAVWGDVEEEDEEWDGEIEYEGEYDNDAEQPEDVIMDGLDNMDRDDEISWEESAVERARAVTAPSTAIAAGSTSTLTSPVVNSPVSPYNNHPTHLRSIETTNAQAPQSQPTVTVSFQQQQQQQQQQSSQSGISPILRQQSSRERLTVDVNSVSPNSLTVASPVNTPPPSSPANRVLVDPAVAGDTRKISATPSIAREAARQFQLQQNEEAARRAREEADESSNRLSKVKEPQLVSSASSSMKEKPSNDSIKSSSSSGGKLRKGRDSPAPSSSQEEEGGGKKEKKKISMFGGLFGRKKDKKDKTAEGGIEHIRNSEDSTTTSETSSSRVRVSNESRHTNVSSLSVNVNGNGTSPSVQVNPPPVISRMQQVDQHQQALYQQYLRSSPANAPEPPSHGHQSASIVMPNGINGNNTTNPNNLATPGFRTQGGRPGSLIISPTGLDGHGPLPELSVIRVFAGENLHTEATFKTVLLNASTTAADLVKQAKQRFRLPTAENDADYYLEIKQIEGQSAVLLPDQKPLGVFESLVEAAEMELPKVKRSSVGSISSVSSNLSLHPAIKKLSMNDFTDDSAVKFYLNRRSSNEDMNALYNADKAEESILRMSMDESEDMATNPAPLLTVTTASGTSVTPERFNSPSVRFAVQVYIFPDDLPDEMIFDPQTEAIVPKSSLRDRVPTATIPNNNISQSQRRKILHFPKNTTVAEVIELALERFGIAEGVVDGGDEVEDKLAKRVSLARVRYGLAAVIDAQERQLHPSSKVVDAFTRPPVFRAIDRRSGEKRRSADSAYLLNATEDIRPDDPIFILRRATGLRTSGKSKPTPLDDYALQKKHHSLHSPHKDNISVEIANVYANANANVHGGEENTAHNQHPSSKTTPSPTTMSRQELIAAQRLLSREKQRAILTAQTNSERGVDVVLPGNVMLRSTALDASGDKMRYSYVQDGEIYDISDIVEEEKRAGKSRLQHPQQKKDDWLEGVVRQEGLVGDNLDRLLTRIKDSRVAVVAARAQAQEQQSRMRGESASGSSLYPSVKQSRRVSDLSAYSVDDQEAPLGSPPVVSPLAGSPPVVPPLAKPSSSAGSPPAESSSTVSPTAGSTRVVSPTAGSLPTRSTPSPGVSTSVVQQQRQQRQADIQSNSRSGTPAGPSSTTGRATTPIRPASAAKNDSLRNKQHSAGSLHSDEGSNSTNEVTTPVSVTSTPATTATQPGTTSRAAGNGPSINGRRSPIVVMSDREIRNMITVIELDAGVNWRSPPAWTRQTPDYVDGLFGTPIDLEELHPRIREMYAGTVKQLEEMDAQLDQALALLYPSTRTSERSMSR